MASAPKAGRCLAVRVAPDSVDRAARLLDALIKAAEVRGFEERRHREAEQAKREEEARVVDFDRKLARWEQAERIRSFAATVRRNAELRSGPVPPRGELQRWLDWALARADRLDPLNADRDDLWPPPTRMIVRIDGRESGSWPYGGGYGGTPIAPPPVSAESDPEGVRSTAPADDDRDA